MPQTCVGQGQAGTEESGPTQLLSVLFRHLLLLVLLPGLHAASEQHGVVDMRQGSSTTSKVPHQPSFILLFMQQSSGTQHSIGRRSEQHVWTPSAFRCLHACPLCSSQSTEVLLFLVTLLAAL